ncbi:MAG: ATP-binding protein [Chitinophagales bacterium]|nr:ATP-binding protein [Chitinophagales bacterium]
MLVELSITNFKSIKTTQTFSMLPASKIKERYNDLISVPNYTDLYLLRSAILYGPNNAGKSNVLKSFYALRFLVEKSHTFNEGEKITANEYFIFDQKTIQQPTIFVVDFIAQDGLRYEYKCEFDSNNILFESLYYYPTGRQKESKTKLYVRVNGKKMDFNKDIKGLKRSLEKDLGHNQLFLSKTGNNNPERLKPVYDFFSSISNHFLDINAFEQQELRKAVTNMITNDDSYRQKIADLLRSTDTGIVDIHVEENKINNFHFPDELPDDLKQKLVQKLVQELKFAVKTTHRMFDGGQEIGNKKISLEQESDGTQKLFTIGGFMYEALQKGQVMLIDELDKSLHSELTSRLIDLFNNDNSNPNNAQLILSTHDSTLLNNFDKDQIYFVEKDYYGQSELTALADIEGVRKNVNREQWYRAGRFGAVPTIKSSLNLISNG